MKKGTKKTKVVEEVKIEEVVKKPFIKKPVIEELKKEIVVETISTEKKVIIPTFNKVEILTKVPIPEGSVRCIVLIDHNGMLDNLRAGDIIDVPDRRYKTLSMRGLVKEYKGEGQPNKRR